MRLPRALALLAIPSAALTLDGGANVMPASNDGGGAASPPISVSLRAPWSAPHLLFEALEAANAEDPDAFWPLLTHITGRWVLNEAGIDAEALSKHLSGEGVSPLASAPAELVYQTAQRVMAQQDLLTAKGARDNWELALALHSEAPKVEAHWNAYLTSGMEQKWEAQVGEGQRAQCGSWVEWGDQVICDEATLRQKLQGAHSSMPEPTTIRPFDHVFSSTPSGPASGRSSAGSTQAQSTVILYADPFSPNFWTLHTTLFEHALGSRPALPGFDGGSAEPAFAYVLRWRPPRSSESGSASSHAMLSGYGASLDLKKVDYLVIDDRKLGSIEAGDVLPNTGQSEEAARAELDDRAWLDKILKAKPSDRKEVLSSLTEKEIQTLGVRAANVIASSPDPLRALRQLSQDFPLHAIALARRGPKPSKAFLEELAKAHEETFEAGHNSAWINGQPILDADFTPFGLLQVLRDERKLVNSLADNRLNLSSKQAIDLLSQDSLASAQDKASQQGVFFDASDRIERAAGGEDGAGAIDWWNDLETDETHPTWSDSLQDLLRPLWPGQFPMIRRNLFNTVFVMDLGRKDICRYAADSVFAASLRIGLHVGFVPAGLERQQNGDEALLSTQVARLYWRVLEELGPGSSAKFLKKISMTPPRETNVIDLKSAVREFRKIMEAESTDAVTDWSTEAKQVLDGSKSQKREQSVKSYVERLRLTLDESELGHVLVNGQHVPFSPQVFQYLHQLISGQMQTLASMVYHQKLTEDDDVSTVFYDLPTTFKARSALVFPAADEDTDRPLRQQAVNLVTALRTAPASLATSAYIYPHDTTAPINATVWLFADFDSVEGAKLLVSTLEALGTESFRLGVVHSPSPSTSPEAKPPLLLSTLLSQALSSEQSDARRPEALLQVAREAMSLYESLPKPQLGRIQPDEAGAEQIKLKSAEGAANYAQERGWQVGASIEADRAWREAAAFAQACGVQSGSPSLLINGKLISGLDAQTITTDDISTLLAYEGNRVIRGVAEELVAVDVPLDSLSREQRAELVTLASSVINVAYHRDVAKEGMFTTTSGGRTSVFDDVETKHISFELGNLETATLRLFAIVNPLAETAQRWSSTLGLLASLPDVHIRVILNPVPQLSEVPIKRFYRYSAPSTLRFDVKGSEKREPLVFAGMSEDAVLTLGLDTPSTWLTMPEEAVYDLDNIRLRDVPANARSAGVTAIYELKSILIQGHARDEASLRAIPKGLQLILETPDGSEQLDTIVMANLAYFQFRARPGLYRLRLRPGRSEELYEMVSVGNLGWESPTVNVTGLDITLDSLQGLTIYPRVRKRVGKERESLVVSLDANPAGSAAKAEAGAAATDDATPGKGLLGRLADKASDALGKAAGGGSPPPSPAARKQADINIFTVASGHLYERMTYIMILSVLRHTKSSVKFWFIENFLSPSFKTFIPHLAKEYGFEYELVTYAWPHWLRSQREKQRVIWGYKILFLDVLFPLDLSKVIFVDADQIVRADLKELIEEDLQGAPYAYPPMGNDSYDMDNYRFWEQGYWKNFLRGKPYHISALYVVDLVRFRRVAAGDMLRGQYQGLSADPGSLANLDQDLPNNMQFQLPIHTLDKNWLWCETWCAAERLPLAKTIDLCQNPRSREAKLDRARRQIPEWTAYDDEVAAFAKRLAEKDELGTNVVAKAEVKEDASGKVHDEL